MRVGIIAGVLAAAVLLGIGLGLYYRSVGSEIAGIRSSLVTEAQLARIADVAAGLEKLEKRPPE